MHFLLCVNLCCWGCLWIKLYAMVKWRGIKWDRNSGYCCCQCLYIKLYDSSQVKRNVVVMKQWVLLLSMFVYKVVRQLSSEEEWKWDCCGCLYIKFYTMVKWREMKAGMKQRMLLLVFQYCLSHKDGQPFREVLETNPARLSAMLLGQTQVSRESGHCRLFSGEAVTLCWNKNMFDSRLSLAQVCV